MSQTTEHEQLTSSADAPRTAEQPSTGEPTIQWYGPGRADQTQPLGAQPQTPATEPGAAFGPPSAPVGPTGDEPQRPARDHRRWVDMALAAVVAAVVAGGTTGAVVAATNDPAPATQTVSQTGGSPAAGTAAGPVTQSAGQAVNWSKVAGAVEPSVVAISTESQAG